MTDYKETHIKATFDGEDVVDFGENAFALIYSDDSKTDKAIAERITKLWNTYPDLLEALEKIKSLNSNKRHPDAFETFFIACEMIEKAREV